jgi:hypothetical protein
VDAGLLAYDLDEAIGLIASAGTVLSDLRRGQNRLHLLTGLLRQSIELRPSAGYEDVNDAKRLSVNPAICGVRQRSLGRSCHPSRYARAAAAIELQRRYCLRQPFLRSKRTV